MEIICRVVVDDTADTVLVVVQRNQGTVTPGFLQNLGAVQEIGVLNAANRLARADAVGIVGVGVVIKGLELASLFPGQIMTEVLYRVALSIVLDSLAIKSGEQILLRCISVGVSLAVLLDDVAVVIILHSIDNFAIYRLGKKLTECIVGVDRGVGYRSFVNRVGLNNGGNTLLSIVAVREGSAVGENDLADELGSSRGLNLLCVSVTLPAW